MSGERGEDCREKYDEKLRIPGGADTSLVYDVKYSIINV